MVEFTLPPYEPRDSRPIEPVASRFGKLFALLVLLFVLWQLPNFIERVMYAVSRGRQRAEADTARSQLPGTTLESISREGAWIAKAIGPSVVHIDTKQSLAVEPHQEFRRFAVPRGQFVDGQASGVIIDEAGYILTNAHVVEAAQEISVRLSDNEVRYAEIIGMDPLTDLAVLRIRPGGLLAAEWGDSDGLQVGSLVWAVGNPFGLDRSVTLGIVSAKSRRGLGRVTSAYQDFLQTDAAVNPGNSGGPLVDATGKVVGINTAILGSSFQGVSFSIPSSVAKDVYVRLKNTGRVQRGYLGVMLREVNQEMAETAGLDAPRGALVEKVSPDTPASRARIRENDVITIWNGEEISNQMELRLLVAATKVGAKVPAELLRGGEKIQVEVTVDELPPQPTPR